MLFSVFMFLFSVTVFLSLISYRICFLLFLPLLFFSPAALPFFCLPIVLSTFSFYQLVLCCSALKHQNCFITITQSLLTFLILLLVYMVMEMSTKAVRTHIVCFKLYLNSTSLHLIGFPRVGVFTSPLIKWLVGWVVKVLANQLFIFHVHC